jgi:DNA-binding protein HU-beta
MATKPAAKTAAKKPAAAAKTTAAAKPAAAAKKAPAQATVPLSKIIAELAEEHEMSKKAAAAFFDSFVQLTVKNLKKGNKVRITGLGILAVRKRAARMGRNPATGEAIKIKASKKVAFRVAKDLKEAI